MLGRGEKGGPIDRCIPLITNAISYFFLLVAKKIKVLRGADWASDAIIWSISCGK
jgi:hypothetical protein